tara:strand:+ start:38623 stop:38907 length:285 start_codon:yes stop_codon:yes gene_type:complete
MITKLTLALLAVACGWITVLAGVMLLSDAAPGALVLLPDATFFRALPPGVSILSQNAISVTLASEIPGFATALYQSGAILVLPAGLLGCAPLTS